MPEKKSSSIENKFIQGIKLEIKNIETDKTKGIVINQYEANGNEYIGEVEFNDDRSKYHAIIKHNGRTISLSFFQTIKQAINNIELWIVIANGGGQNIPNQNIGVGD